MSFKLDFVGVGAARCGTSWLASTLMQHPDIFLPRKKELHYFNRDEQYEDSLLEYKKYFAGGNDNQQYGEYTPKYSIRPLALSRIKKHFPRVKILFSIREPIARAYSHYLFFRTIKSKERITNFRAALTGPHYEDYVIRSLYFPQIQRLYDIFGSETVKIILFEELLSNPKKTFCDIFKFLEVDHNFEPDFTQSRRNDSISFNSQFVNLLRRLQFRLGAGKNLKFESTRFILSQSIKNIADLFKFIPVENNYPDMETRKYLHQKYFSEDISRLENEFGFNLKCWTVK